MEVCNMLMKMRVDVNVMDVVRNLEINLKVWISYYV